MFGEGASEAYPCLSDCHQGSHMPGEAALRAHLSCSVCRVNFCITPGQHVCVCACVCVWQLQAVELPLTHPELYDDIGIKPPKVRLWGQCMQISCCNHRLC